MCRLSGFYCTSTALEEEDWHPDNLWNAADPRNMNNYQETGIQIQQMASLHPQKLEGQVVKRQITKQTAMATNR